jgi:hypothetical protein
MTMATPYVASLLWYFTKSGGEPQAAILSAVHPGVSHHAGPAQSIVDVTVFPSGSNSYQKVAVPLYDLEPDVETGDYCTYPRTIVGDAREAESGAAKGAIAASGELT